MEKEKIKIETNNFESLPSKEIKPKIKPKIAIKKEKILDKDIVEDSKPLPKPKLEFNIASMLKDLRNEKSNKKIESDEDQKEEQIIEKPKEEISKEIAKLSISEIDLLRQQLSLCWNAPAGAIIEKGMTVKISAKLQQNRRIITRSFINFICIIIIIYCNIYYFIII